MGESGFPMLNQCYILKRNRESTYSWGRSSYRNGNLRLWLARYTVNASPREAVEQMLIHFFEI